MPDLPSLEEAQDLVGLKFKVWCPIFPRRGHTLCLIGSLPQLGSWDITHAPAAFSTNDSHTWKAEAQLPAHADFQWCWVLVRADRADNPQWEHSRRRQRKLHGFSGTLHSVWGQDGEVFLQAATSVELTTHRLVDSGQRLVLSGSSPSAGRWDLKEAIAATEFPPKSGYWKANVIFDANDVLNFKWAIVDLKNPSVAVAEEAVRHCLCGGGGWLAAVAPWDSEAVVVVQRDVSSEPGDFLGRPEEVVAERRRREEEIQRWLGCEVSPTKQAEPGKQPSPQPASFRPTGKLSKSEKQISAEHPAKEATHMKSSPRQQARVPQTAKKHNARKSSFHTRNSMLKGTPSKSPRNVPAVNEAGYPPSPGVLYLKGKGQTRAAQELSAEDVGHQVALMDIGHVLPRTPRDTQSEAKSPKRPTGPRDKLDVTSMTEKRAENTERRERVDNTQRQERVEKTERKKNPGTERDVPDIPETDDDAKKPPVFERDVSMVTSLPPTWSMMVEDDVARSTQPEILDTPWKSEVKKPRDVITPVTAAARATAALPRATSLQSLGVSRLSLGGSISASAVSWNNGEPSGLGHEDFLKSNAEIVEERKHRQMWQQKRDQLQIELEKKHHGEDKKKATKVTKNVAKQTAKLPTTNLEVKVPKQVKKKKTA